MAEKKGLWRRGKISSIFRAGVQTDPTLPLPPIELTPLRTSDPAPFNASFRYGRENEGLRCFTGELEGGGDFEGDADGRERDEDEGIGIARVGFRPPDLAPSSLVSVGDN